MLHFAALVNCADDSVGGILPLESALQKLQGISEEGHHSMILGCRRDLVCFCGRKGKKWRFLSNWAVTRTACRKIGLW